jgi:hypothetical protein
MDTLPPISSMVMIDIFQPLGSARPGPAGIKRIYKARLYRPATSDPRTPTRGLPDPAQNSGCAGLPGRVGCPAGNGRPAGRAVPQPATHQSQDANLQRDHNEAVCAARARPL